jgi:hypothetical protein
MGVFFEKQTIPKKGSLREGETFEASYGASPAILGIAKNHRYVGV